MPNTPSLSPTQLEVHLYDTLERLDTWAPDANATDTLDELRSEYEFWGEMGEFTSRYGVCLERMPPGQPALRIPPALGYKPDGDNYVIHFTPPYFSVHNRGGKQDFTYESIDSPRKDQKYLTSMNGLTGSLHYITLVESGLLPKPDYIIGVTNPSMARFAQRAGFKTLASVVEEMVGSGAIDIGDRSVESIDQKVEATADKLDTNGLSEEETNETLLDMLKIAAYAKDSGDKELYRDALIVANSLVLNKPLSESTVVWGRYEDFRDGVTRFKDKFGSRILKLADRDLVALGV